MRFIDLSFPVNRLHRLLTSVSVRTRIIVLALIPVVGFLANGLTYVSGEGDVGTAFDTVKRSAVLADASRDFKSAVAAMRISVKDFSANPSDNLVVSFEQAHAVALQSLDAIASSINRRMPQISKACARKSWFCETPSLNWCASKRRLASTTTRACAAIFAKPATRSSASSMRT